MTIIEYKGKKIIFISDTHGNHSNLDIPKADFLIHCGDACTDGDINQLSNFFDWFEKQDIKYKLFIPGNHDLIFDLDPEHGKSLVPKNILYLEDSYTVIEGIAFYIIPARPWLQEYPTEKRKIDFLITHGPAYGVLDLNLGCRELRKFIRKVQPTFHIFGHIHELGGKRKKVGNCEFVNVSGETT